MYIVTFFDPSYGEEVVAQPSDGFMRIEDAKEMAKNLLTSGKSNVRIFKHVAKVTLQPVIEIIQEVE